MSLIWKYSLEDCSFKYFSFQCWVHKVIHNRKLYLKQIQHTDFFQLWNTQFKKKKKNQYMCMGVKKENEVLVSISLASIILLAFSISSMALRQLFCPYVNPCFKHSWPSCQTVAHDVWTLRHQEKLQHLKGFTLVSCISLMNIKNMPKKFHDWALHS